ncbi:MAG: hypothetical protein R3330_19345, partial [Saprospiraceae bacterium]|nr:hypothetical protein [Saprospiraceae bacterium]
MNPIPEHDQSLIDKYLQGDLTETEQTEFNTRLQDPEFKKNVDDMRALREAIAADGRTSMRSLFRLWDRQHRSRRLVPYRAIAAAAAVVVLIVGVFVLLPNKQPTGLASAYLEPYPNVVAP